MPADQADLDKIQLFADTHAIDAANFQINLGLAIDSADLRRFDEKADEKTDELRALFPAIDSPEVIRFEIDNGAASHSRPPPPARELALFASDGRQLWAGSFANNRILVSCRNYTKWQEIWPQANNRLNALLACIDPYKPVQSVDYSVTDTFRAKQADDVLVPDNIFREHDLVSGQVRNLRDPIWDFRQGWFDNLASEAPVLIRIEGQGVIDNDRAVTSIHNLHSQRFRGGMTVGELIADDPEDGSKADQIFDVFHRKNKNLLRTLLTDCLLARMGLKNTGEQS